MAQFLLLKSLFVWNQIEKYNMEFLIFIFQSQREKKLRFYLIFSF